MKNYISWEKDQLIERALRLVNELAESDRPDIDGVYSTNDFNSDKLKSIIMEAHSIKSDLLWKVVMNNIR